MKTNKSLGQNFLRDQKILKKIVDSAAISKNDIVIEVGPGEGILTKLLINRSKMVIAIEKDGFLVKKLEEIFANEIKEGLLKIIEGDILNFEEYKDFPEFKLVGNIPYYITGKLLKKFLTSEKQPESITFVIQKEVANRIITKDHKESILSISVKAYGKPKYTGTIKAGSFFPKPKVDSAILNIENINKEKFNGSTELENKFFLLIKTGFSHKRKFLIKNLAPLFRKNSEGLKEIFKENKIPENIRAEDLSLENWFYITKKFSPKKQ